MYTYKRIIKCPNSLEYEYYKSIKKVGKYYGGRGVNKSLSSAKQKQANNLRTIRHWKQVIDCNFTGRDWFARFSAPFGTFESEDEFMAEVNRFFNRVRYACKKAGIEFKYIGFRECGKSGKNWHMHIIISEEVRPIAMRCWKYKNGGMNFTPLYGGGNYEKLAEYIHKDVCGQKRMMASRNLLRPEITVVEAGKREVRKLERGEMVKVPDGYYLAKDDPEFNVNDITGATWYFKFVPLAFKNLKTV